MADLPASDRCVPGEDLTAFAHGELAAWHRAEISRHALRCAACRAALSDAERVFFALRSLGAAGGDWREDLTGAIAARGVDRRRRAGVLTLATTASAVAAAALALAVLGPHAGRTSPEGSPPPFASDVAIADARATPRVARDAPPPSAQDAAALVREQRPDGRWAAPDAGGGASRDDAATGLALVALAPRADDPAVAKALGRGAMWLLSRQDARGAFGGDGFAVEDLALATSGLLEVYAHDHDARLRPAVDRAVRRLAQSAPDLDADAPGSPGAAWALHALTRARDVGFDRLDGPVDRLSRLSHLPAGESDAGRLLARAGDWGGESSPRTARPGWALAVQLVRERL
jgi:hypothetical protein